MQQAGLLFEKEIERIRELDGFYGYVTEVLKLPPQNLSDILRSQLVYSVSAFDKLIHDVVREGMIEIFMQQRNPTDAYQNYKISMQQSQYLWDSDGDKPPEVLLNEIILEAFRNKSFQQPDKVSEALSHVWPEKHKWRRIAEAMEMHERSLRIMLNNIVTRRNQIVHEMDINPFTEEKFPVDRWEIRRAIDFIASLGSTIVRLLIK
jgi:hypothetical protein